MKPGRIARSLVLVATLALAGAGCKSSTYGGGESPKEPPAPKTTPPPAPAR